jgi:hypothetical protein
VVILVVTMTPTHMYAKTYASALLLRQHFRSLTCSAVFNGATTSAVAGRHISVWFVCNVRNNRLKAVQYRTILILKYLVAGYGLEPPQQQPDW